MDKTTSVIAAFDAGKLPTQQQISHFIDWLQKSGITSIEPSPAGGDLSQQGKVILGGIRQVLESYKLLGEHKNNDNLLQEALWHLSAGDISNTTVDAPIDKDEAKSDAEAIRVALRTLVQVIWSNLTNEGTGLSHDFASFARFALADAAESIEQSAARAKDGLRQTEDEVQQGERDNLGRKKKSDEEKEHDADPKVQFEKGMDTIKGAGTTVIGAGQDAKASVQDIAANTRARLRDSYFKIIDRAQKDPEYRSSISTVFDTAQKWVTKSLDTASDVNSSTTLESFVQDPTPEQHTISALRALKTLAERLSGEKSLDDLFNQARLCAVDVRQDQDLKSWFESFFAHVRKSLDEPGYARSDEASKEWEGLQTRWNELLDKDGDAGQKWKKDVAAFRKELHTFEKGLAHDKDLHRVRRAHAKFADDLQETVVNTSAAGIQLALDQASWFWQDLFRVYVPRFLNLLKDVPIPRTEYKDNEFEFVLENLDISSLNLFPSHVYIRNITDVDITAPAGAPSTTEVGTLTHIRAQALQLSLKEISFWFNAKTVSLGPSEFSGLVDLTLPPKGIDVDIQVRLIPNTPEGLKKRAAHSAFHVIETVEVHISPDVELKVRDSNHSVLVTLFKPAAVTGLRKALEKVFTDQVRASLVWADSIAWDVSQRAEVFADTGLRGGLAYVGAIWSEIGRLQKKSGGGSITEGWRATGTGLVNETLQGGEAAIAIGAEPQILSGEKHGPLGTFSEPLADKAKRGADKLQEQTGVNLTAGAGDAQGVVQQAKDTVKEGVRQAKSFKQAVEDKTEVEKSKEGWESTAFDL